MTPPCIVETAKVKTLLSRLLIYHDMSAFANLKHISTYSEFYHERRHLICGLELFLDLGFCDDSATIRSGGRV